MVFFHICLATFLELGQLQQHLTQVMVVQIQEVEVVQPHFEVLLVAIDEILQFYDE